MGGCQKCGPFLGPYYNTGPNTGPNLGDPKRDHNFDKPPCTCYIHTDEMREKEREGKREREREIVREREIERGRDVALLSLGLKALNQGLWFSQLRTPVIQA